MPYEINAQLDTMPLKDLGGFIETKFKEMETLYTENDSGKNFDKEKTEEFQARNGELGQARERFSTLKSVSDDFSKHHQFYQDLQKPNYKVPHGNGGDPNQVASEYKSLGDLFIESSEYKDIRENNVNYEMRTPKVQIPNVTIKSLEESALKATMTTSAGWSPYPTLAPRGPVLCGLT
jgi:hypothetical protein